MSTKIKGKVWKFGDILGDVDVVPFQYVTDFSMEPEEIAKVIMTGPNGDPDFSKKVKKGDILVAKSYRWGHETGVIGLKELGIAAVVADVGPTTIFAMYGIPIVTGSGVTEDISQGDIIEVDYVKGLIKNLTTGKTIKGQVLPKFYLDMVLAGGLVNVVKKIYKEMTKKT